MPIYEYQCEKCGERFEKLVRFDALSPQVKCPRCGSSRVHKAVSLCGMGKPGPASDSSCAPTGG